MLVLLVVDVDENRWFTGYIGTTGRCFASVTAAEMAAEIETTRVKAMTSSVRMTGTPFLAMRRISPMRHSGTRQQFGKANRRCGAGQVESLTKMTSR
jgi:hypothetical protein